MALWTSASGEKFQGMGGVVSPVELRKVFGIADGDDVIFSRTTYSIQITTFKHAIRQAQNLVGRHIPKNVSLVNKLHQDRQQDTTFV